MLCQRRCIKLPNMLLVPSSINYCNINHSAQYINFLKAHIRFEVNLSTAPKYYLKTMVCHTDISTAAYLIELDIIRFRNYFPEMKNESGMKRKSATRKVLYLLSS